MGLNDTRAIIIKYYHNVKGFFGETRIEEPAYFYTAGFSEDTLALEPGRMEKTLKKVLDDMKRKAERFAYVDIAYEERLRFRVDADYSWENGRQKTTYYLMTWTAGAYTYNVKDKVTVKEILRKSREFMESNGTKWDIEG